MEKVDLDTARQRIDFEVRCNATLLAGAGAIEHVRTQAPDVGAQGIEPEERSCVAAEEWRCARSMRVLDPAMTPRRHVDHALRGVVRGMTDNRSNAFVRR